MRNLLTYSGGISSTHDHDLRDQIVRIAMTPAAELEKDRQYAIWAAQVLFEGTLRGFHREAKLMVRAHGNRALKGVVLDRGQYPRGADAVMYASGTYPDYIYMVQMLAVTPVDRHDRKVARAYRANTQWSLIDMPRDLKGFRGEALKQSAEMACILNNHVFTWEVRKYENAQTRPYRPTLQLPAAVRPLHGLATVTDLCARLRPQKEPQP